MAARTAFLVKYPVTHAKSVKEGEKPAKPTRYKRGSVIPAGTLSVKDEEALLASGHIVEDDGTNVVRVPVALGGSTLAKMTVAELTEYAVAHGIELVDTTKPAIMAAIAAQLDVAGVAGLDTTDAVSE